MEYKNIAVTVAPDKELLCTYDMIVDGTLKQHYSITCGDKNLYLDKNLVYIKGNMPFKWQEPIIAKLRTLINVKEYPDGP